MSSLPPPCPHCGRPAPIVYRGPEARCTACGRARPPFTSPSVNLAGKPSILGGSVARVAGIAILAIGAIVALLLGGLFSALFPASVFGWIVGGVIAAIASFVGFSLLFGGKKLAARGEETLRETRERAIFELAEARGRLLAASDVAAALALSHQEADAALTALAKREPDHVALEVAEDGAMLFRFAAPGKRIGSRVRFHEEGAHSVEDDLAEWDERAARSQQKKN